MDEMHVQRSYESLGPEARSLYDPVGADGPVRPQTPGPMARDPEMAFFVLLGNVGERGVSAVGVMSAVASVEAAVRKVEAVAVVFGATLSP